MSRRRRAVVEWAKGPDRDPWDIMAPQLPWVRQEIEGLPDRWYWRWAIDPRYRDGRAYYIEEIVPGQYAVTWLGHYTGLDVGHDIRGWPDAASLALTHALRRFDGLHNKSRIYQYEPAFQVAWDLYSAAKSNPRRVKNNPADLRPLPYKEGALDPVIDADTVRRHHGTHQAGYVKGWNKTEKRIDTNRTASGGMLRASYESLVFNGAGVILHEMYWENLAPPGKGGRPSGHLLSCIKRCFGSVANLAHQLIEVGANIRGSGWVVLSWVPRFDRMVVLPVQEHEMRWIPGAVPLIVLDVWEHAYYKQYGAGRKEYLKKLWGIIDWNEVSQRYGGQAKTNPDGYRRIWGAHGAHGPFPQAEGGYFPPTTRINPKNAGRVDISRYEWMTLDEIGPFVPLMQRQGVSEVARSPRGFLPAYKKARGVPERLGHDSYSGQEWVRRRNNFVARHMGQVESKGEALWKGKNPSRRHLALIAWAYTPDPDGVSAWLSRR